MKSKAKIILAVITALALLTTGTFTMYQAAIIRNVFNGKTSGGGVTIHDDFDGDAMKDVFVENQGDVTIYIRAKLDETMNLRSYSWRPRAPKDPDEWITHKYAASAVDCGNANHMGHGLFHDYFSWTMGGSKWYMPGDGSRAEVNDTANYEGVSGARQTPYASIITAAQWKAKSEGEKEAFIGWIYALDGYAYYSQPLEPDSATGLLIHGVAKDGELGKLNYYYAIDVIVEIADIEDVPMMRDGAESVVGDGKTYTEADQDGKDILNWLTRDDVMPPNPDATFVLIHSGNRTIAIGQSINLKYNVYPYGYDSGKLITWSSDEAPGIIDIGEVSGADGSVTITGVSEGTVKLTLTIGEGEEEISHYIMITVHAPISD